MPRRKAPTVSLEEARTRFEEWRNNRSGKARIPAELWSAAVEVARKEGINRTARQLHVAWDDLKRGWRARERFRSNRVRQRSWNWCHHRHSLFPNSLLKWKATEARSCESS